MLPDLSLSDRYGNTPQFTVIR
ncbi:protein of unknown function [uncultured Sphingopyxis sp.]|uniref:Uncharacterized protein n=1 Tax=uncultured Sphingopyxis sp. TaxID=310581 RepID=A0A1Y5PUP6_9SPHN|nr:protein of unknown function [uncultured Sphingopyxis sp.]